MLDIEPIRRRRIYEDVAERLQQLMLDGTLGEGDVLPSERELMEQFKVGRPAIREALMSLQKAGLVSIANGERARVVRPDPKHFIQELSASVRSYLAHPAGMRHFQNARLHLEMALTRHAAREARPADIARIGDALTRNRRDLGDMAAFEASDIAFHYEIVLVSQNPLFDGVHRAVVQWLSEQRSVTLKIAQAKEMALAFHERIYEAIAGHDPDAAEAAMRAHLESVAALYWDRDRPAG
ncbi:FCD domain-containing protein [Ancylobacter vacuolatus]|uniref:DNA-binding FadR family transcriptional regulator n=1 Tax=Ancylobacter vacuolatus TaxID=223389 RepID=A0ABU0DL76_9HYPH|nr:FCD domain-containing protein [Ancylobacter vacuolatus]MDQ0349182.1 DNA-binding FadR family transcriptional regulator [Ancylobacter vacuolatus]